MSDSRRARFFALAARYSCALIFAFYLGLLLEGIRMGAYNLLDYQSRLQRMSYAGEFLLNLPGAEVYYKHPVYLYILVIVSLGSALRAMCVCLQGGMGRYACIRAGSVINFGAIAVVSLFVFITGALLLPAMPILMLLPPVDLPGNAVGITLTVVVIIMSCAVIAGVAKVWGSTARAPQNIQNCRDAGGGEGPFDAS